MQRRKDGNRVLGRVDKLKRGGGRSRKRTETGGRMSIDELGESPWTVQERKAADCGGETQPAWQLRGKSAGVFQPEHREFLSISLAEQWHRLKSEVTI